MASRVIKISEENYKLLLKISSDIQEKTGSKATFDDTLNFLKSKNFEGNKKKILEFGGKKFIDEKSIKNLKVGWNKWTEKYA